MLKWMTRVAGACVLSAASFSGVLAQEATPPVEVQVQEVEVALEPAIAELAQSFAFVQQGAEGGSEYWIGVSLDPFLNDVVKSRLNVDHGLSINTVFPESPAEKAGLKTYDIVVKAGDAAVKEPADLVKAVGGAKEKELAVVVIRNGKEMTFKIVPTRRAQLEPKQLTVKGFSFDPADPKAAETYRQHIEKAMEALKNSKDPNQPFNMFFMRPGVVGGPRQTITARVASGLPKNVSVQITKEGEQPAKIVVKRDNQTWEVTEDKLDGLPDDLKLHVQHMFHQPGGARAFAFHGAHAVPAVPAVPAIPGVPGVHLAPGGQTLAIPAPAGTRELRVMRADKADADSAKKIEQLLEEVRQLRKEVQEIRSKSGN